MTTNDRTEMWISVCIVLSIIGACYFGWYIYKNTTIVIELVPCNVYNKEYLASYYSTECNPVYLPVTKQVIEYDGTLSTETTLEFSHNEYYQQYHPERYLISIVDNNYITTTVDDKKLFDALHKSQQITLCLSYRCWKNEKRSIVDVNLCEDL